MQLELPLFEDEIAERFIDAKIVTPQTRNFGAVPIVYNAHIKRNGGRTMVFINIDLFLGREFKIHLILATDMETGANSPLYCIKMPGLNNLPKDRVIEVIQMVMRLLYYD